MNTFTLLIVVALILAIVAAVKPSWPVLSVSVILVCVALLIGKSINI